VRCPSCEWAEGHEVTTFSDPVRRWIGECGHQWIEGDDPWVMHRAPRYDPPLIQACLGPTTSITFGVGGEPVIVWPVVYVRIHHGPAAPYPEPPTAEELWETAGLGTSPWNPGGGSHAR